MQFQKRFIQCRIFYFSNPAMCLQGEGINSIHEHGQGTQKYYALEDHRRAAQG
jgi:hypothetical protein